MDDLSHLRQAAEAAARLMGGWDESRRLQRAQYLRIIADRGDVAASLIVSLAHMGAAMMLATQAIDGE